MSGNKTFEDINGITILDNINVDKFLLHKKARNSIL